jgi:hypothetical protein
MSFSSSLQNELLRILGGLPGGLRVSQCREVLRQPRPYLEVYQAIDALCHQGLVVRVSRGRYARASGSRSGALAREKPARGG